MKGIFKKYYKFFIIIFLFGLAIVWLIDFYDDAKKDLFVYVNTNTDISNLVGEVMNITITKRIFGQAASGSSSYRKYFLKVSGKKGAARIIIIATKDAGDNWSFVVDSVKKTGLFIDPLTPILIHG